MSVKSFSVCIILLLSMGAVAASPGFEENMDAEFMSGIGEMETAYFEFQAQAEESFRRDVAAMWGEFIGSTKKDWVEYSTDKTGRSRVDFKAGEVLVEVLVPEKAANESLLQVEKRLTDEIERLISDSGGRADDQSPILEDQLEDVYGKSVTVKNRAAFARGTLQAAPIEKESLSTPAGRMVKARVAFLLVPDHLRRRAEKYLEPVRVHAKRFDVSVALVLAVIHTESYFNPKAVSPAPAYGLMQLAPLSGARDAYKYAYGMDKVLSADYLYQPERNIELGCAYLGLLKNQYFKELNTREAVLFCAVSAYNTGPGNVSRALCDSPSLHCAIFRANSMSSEALFTYLKNNLPYSETQDYLEKVVRRISLYEDLD